MEAILGHTVAYLGVAILVAIVVRRMRLPYTVGLVIAGAGLAATGLETGAMLTHELIFDVILPPLLFEAALSIRWRLLSQDMAPVLLLSTLGVVISAAVVAGGLTRFAHWPAEPAVVFGVLIAATDPIAVLAMFKDVGVKGRVRLLVESESLFNDGSAAVLFALALNWSQPGAAPQDALSALGSVVTMTGGGIAIGLAIGGAAILIAGRTGDHLVEAMLTTVAAYGAFLIAEAFHCSGVLSTVAAGLMLGNLGVLREEEERNALSSGGRAFVIELWEFVAFIANSLIFLLIGLKVAAIRFSGVAPATFALAVGLVLLARALAVYPLCATFRFSKWAMSSAEQHVLFWGGLHGALALALALALPESFPLHDEILVVAFGVVVFSVVVQGLTFPLLMRRLTLAPSADPAESL